GVGVGARRVWKSVLTGGMLVALQTRVAGFAAPVNSLVLLGSTFQDVAGNLNRLDDVLRYPVDPQLAGAAAAADTTPPRLAGYVELRDVTFGYSRLEAPLIERLSLRLKPGDRVALVGASGSGKSTVSRLGAGLF